MKTDSVRRKRLELFMVLVLSLIGLSHSVSQQVITKSLHDYLFTDYDVNLLPICTEGENVTVQLDIALRQVMELNEPKQILHTNVWLRLAWNDCRLTWTPSSYNNLTGINVLFGDVWFPDITLYDSAADEVMFPGRETFGAYISNTGAVSYNFPTVLTSVCRVNVRYFPFDTQRCSLKFGSWSHHGLDLDLVNKKPQGDTDTFVMNNEWILEGIPVERNVLYYNCCQEPFPDVTYYVVLRRRPSFYVLTMLFPCILVSFVSALTFILPTESGEKVSLEITVLLSLAVFLLVVSEALPPSSDNFPIIGSYFAAAMVLVSISLLQTILIVNVFHRGTNGRKVPRWVKTVCFQYIGRLVFVKPESPGNKVHNAEEKQDNFTECSTIDTYIDLPSDSSSETNLKSNHNHEPDEKIPNGGTELRNGERKLRFLSNSRRPNLEDPTVKLLEEQNATLKYFTDSLRLKAHEENINSEWRDVANILDRLFLVLYCLVTIITTLGFLLQCV